MVSQALHGMGVPFFLNTIAPTQHPYMEMVDGYRDLPRIFRVQFEGPWMKGPVAGQYKRTHYIACLEDGIMEPMLEPWEVMVHEEWWDLAEGMYKHVLKGCTGYHFTHAWHISK